MLLSLTTTHTPATDLGFLLHKKPDRAQTFDLSFGKAHVFYPEATETRCTAVLLLDVDPVGLVRGRGRTLAQYVNDRPYVASSFLCVAIAQVLRSAMNGDTRDRSELAQTAIPLTATIPVLPAYGGEAFLKGLFEPLGYEVSVERLPLDSTFPEWGESKYCSLRLSGVVRLSELLTHLYVLIPTLDAEKHYFVGDEEVEKLVRKGGEWLSGHPQKDTIVRRYLKNRTSLIREALDQLTQEELPGEDELEAKHDEEEQIVERKISLHEQRLGAVLAVLKQSGATSVLDLGCGEGRLIQLLLKEKQFKRILGMDVAYHALESAQRKLNLERLPAMVREKLTLIQGSLIYRDERLSGFDAAAVVEVIEHLDSPRLTNFERSLFEFAQPGTVVVTTPNVEYNTLFETLPAGQLRHKDHRFEWTRAEFQNWATQVCQRFGYEVRFLSVGPEDPELGAPSQMAVFAAKFADRGAQCADRNEPTKKLF
jgi:3' terminal RNA ribose 2'-O-methyltransferase Hen1